MSQEAREATIPSAVRPPVKALILWGLLLLVTGIMVGTKPDSHTVTPEYRKAAGKWWAAQEDLYGEGIHGFLYFPTAAILYSPFTLPPKSIGEVAWRFVGIGLLALSLWRLALLLKPGDPGASFWILSLLVIPAALSSVRNGQANLHLGALMLLAAANCVRARWGWAAALLAIALALKPLALVPLLLCALVYPRIRLPLLLGMVAVAVLPWLHPNPGYVWEQCLSCVRKLGVASVPYDCRMSDLMGMLDRFSVRFPQPVWTALRASAAVATALLALAASRRTGRSAAAFLLFALAAAYLMLFNPRTETNSYVILAPVPAALAALAFGDGHKGAGWGFVLLTLGFAVEVFGGKTLYEWTDVWFKPAVTAVVIVPLLVRFALRGGLSIPDEGEPQPERSPQSVEAGTTA